MPTFDGQAPHFSSQIPFPWDVFPPYIQWAIAYGSAVFSQSPAARVPPGSSTPTHRSQRLRRVGDKSEVKKGQLLVQPRGVHGLLNGHFLCRDYLLLVPEEHLLAFHKENIARNPTHYALPFRLAGPRTVCKFQRAGRGVEAFYNTLLYLDHGRYGKQLSKYGVATVEDFQTELEEWSSLFFSGRLHKPVQFYSPQGTPVEDASFWRPLEVNRLNAIRTALFLLPGAVYSFRTLLTTICGLSYGGDIRVGVAESPRKLENIVAGQAAELLTIYYRLIIDHFPEVRVFGSCIPHSDIELICDRLAACRFGESNVDPVLPARSEGSVPLRRATCPQDGNVRLGYESSALETLTEEILHDHLMLEVPEGEKGGCFRVRLLDALPPRIRDDAWKRAVRRGTPSTLYNTGRGLLAQGRTFWVDHQVKQSPLASLNPPVTSPSARISGYRPTPRDLRASLACTVQRSSAISAVKNALAAGPSKMVTYGLRKLIKRWSRT